jgi:hypothetical protein
MNILHVVDLNTGQDHIEFLCLQIKLSNKY